MDAGGRHPRSRARTAMGLVALSSLLLGACQVLTGLTGYRETGGPVGSGPGGATSSSSSTGGATSSSSGPGGATSSSSGTGGATSSSSGPGGATSSSSGTGGATSSSSGTGGTGGCVGGDAGIVVCNLDGTVKQLQVGGPAGGYIGWTLLGPGPFDNLTVGCAPASGGDVTATPAPMLNLTVLGMSPADLWYYVVGSSSPAGMTYATLPPGDAGLGGAAIGFTAGANWNVWALTVAPDDGSAIWSETEDANAWQILTATAGGSAVTLLTAAAKPTELSADPTDVYWVSANGISSAARVAGAVEAMYYTSPNVVQVAVDPFATGNVYWVEANGSAFALCRSLKGTKPTSCGTPLAIIPGTQPQNLTLATAGSVTTYVYWTQTDLNDDCTNLGVVSRVLIGGDGGITPIAQAPCPQLAVDGPHALVYWSATYQNSGHPFSLIHRLQAP
jgi:hypothetical protein